MVIKIVKTVFSIFILLFPLSCKNDSKKSEDYYKWINDESNGIVHTKQINGFQLSMKFLPNGWLAYKEYKFGLEEGKELDKDSLLKSFASSVTFLFSIADLQDKDILFYKTYTPEELKQKFLEINFNLNEYLWIDTDGSKIHPGLYLMEGTADISNAQKFYIVFNNIHDSVDILAQKEIDLVFNDMFFDTGISHYKFQKENLDEIPTIGFW